MKVIRKYLKNKLGKDDEYIEKILEFQKILPVNSEERVNARQLYNCLGLDKRNWKIWGDKNIVENEFFKENIDWKRRCIYNSGNKTTEYMISLEMGKHLAMSSKGKNAHIYRDYMVEMERICGELLDWEKTRNLSKTNYKPSLQKFTDYIASNGEYYVYNEHWLGCLYGDMLNLIAFGLSANELQEYRKVLDKETRDNLEEEDNRRLYYLQERFNDICCFGFNLKTTINMVVKMYKQKYGLDYSCELHRLDEYIEKSLNKIYK